jgi:hypothetical protein
VLDPQQQAREYAPIVQRRLHADEVDRSVGEQWWAVRSVPAESAEILITLACPVATWSRGAVEVKTVTPPMSAAMSPGRSSIIWCTSPLDVSNPGLVHRCCPAERLKQIETGMRAAAGDLLCAD